nr:hypothetical protein CFP56_40112 [Quercus suber]
MRVSSLTKAEMSTGSVGEWRSWVWAVEASVVMLRKLTCMDAMLDEEALGELEERGDVAMPGLGRTARNVRFIGFSFSSSHGFCSLGL